MNIQTWQIADRLSPELRSPLDNTEHTMIELGRMIEMYVEPSHPGRVAILALIDEVRRVASRDRLTQNIIIDGRIEGLLRLIRFLVYSSREDGTVFLAIDMEIDGRHVVRPPMIKNGPRK